jgi:tetratricopeptide (TPR) repeat protein
MQLTPRRASIVLILIIGAVVAIRVLNAYRATQNAAEQMYQRAIDLGNHHFTKQAIEAYHATLAFDPNFAKAYAALCGAYTSLGEDALALENCNHALELDANQARAFGNRCITYAELEAFDKAEQDCSRAFAISPADAYIYDSRGRLRSAQGRYDEALADYSAALLLNSSYDATHYNRGWVYLQLEDYENALLDFQAAIRINASFKNAYYRSASTMVILDNADGAMDVLTDLITRYPDDALAYYTRATYWFTEYMDYEAAIVDFSRAIALNAEYDEAYIYRAIAYDWRGASKNALIDYCRYFELDGAETQYYLERAEELGGCSLVGQ